jgi:hypothetical protein
VWQPVPVPGAAMSVLVIVVVLIKRAPGPDMRPGEGHPG